MADWEPARAFDFSSPEALSEWFLEGAADVSITADRELLIANVTRRIGSQEVFRSTLWCKEPLWGALKFELEVKGEDRNGNIWFFNAQPLQGHRSIFDWERPQANYVEYTRDPRIRMYTLGILRAHQERINFRGVGGALAARLAAQKADPEKSSDPDLQFDEQAVAEFEKKTVLHSAPSPFDDPEKYYRLELSVRNGRVQLRVDGQEAMDYVDAERAADPRPGGYFAFRNFARTQTWCRSLKVYRAT